ncbi:MAG: phage holin family protein [Elusimicrobiota bacterium]|nr:MAG: phage holin family protein [Elusimicrobiota bacterium]
MKLIINVLISSVAVLITGKLLRGVTMDGFGTAIIVALVLGLVNAALAPALMALTAPVNALTLGLFTFVIIAALVMLTAALVPGFQVAGFWWALGFALVLAVVNSALHSLARA